MWRRLLRRIDWALIIAVMVILVLGMLMIAGSTAESWSTILDSPFVRRQGAYVLAGFGLMVAAMLVDYRYLRSISRLLYAVSLGVLVAVLMVGVEAGGATRWLSVGPMGFQPAEVARLLVVITLANQISAEGSERKTDYSWSDFLWSAVHVMVPAALVVVQPDLGTALVFGAVLIGQLYIAGFSPLRLLFVAVAGVGTVAAVLAAHVRYGLDIPLLQPYMVNRLIAFVDPTADPTGAGYHLQQSVIAIGSGRLTGNGLFRGAGAQLHFLPEQHTDFIFSVLGEQLGMVGVTVLLLAFVLAFLRMLAIAAGASDQFGAVLVGGVVAILFFRVVVNIGMTMGVMPITGLPLPFVSYGGTAVVADLVSVGLVLNVGMRRKKIVF